MGEAGGKEAGGKACPVETDATLVTCCGAGAADESVAA